MDHGHGHDQHHENRAEHDLAYRHAGTDRPVRQPIGKPRLKRPVGHRRLRRFGDDQDNQARQGNTRPRLGQRFGFGADAADIGLQPVNRTLKRVHPIRSAFNRGGQLLAAQFQRALNRRNPRHGVGSQIPKKTARNLHKGNRLNHQKRQRPGPQPPRPEPNRTKKPRHRVERGGKAGRGPHLVKVCDVVVGAGAHKGADVFAALFGIGEGRLAFGVFQRIKVLVFHDISVPSTTVRKRSARVITPTSEPPPATTIGLVSSMAMLISVLSVSASSTRCTSAGSGPSAATNASIGCITALACTTLRREIPATKSAT
mmetsp:Transcript_27060/g.49234  ORF Transcript_27060/g.49234 Transcript_27060/m.49234 type:complete len:314 (-) Transcript_27060:2977-3918(-)